MLYVVLYVRLMSIWTQRSDDGKTTEVVYEDDITSEREVLFSSTDENEAVQWMRAHS